VLLPLADQLPEARAGRIAISILDAVQQAAAAHGYFAAGEEAARRLRAARELRSTERRFVGDVLADILRGLRRLRTLADRKKLSGRALYITYLIDKHAQAAAPGELASLPRVLGHKAAEAGLVASELVQRAQQLAARLHKLGELPPAERVTALGEALSYPDWLVAALLEDFRDAADSGLPQVLALLQTQNQRAPLTVRANLLKCTRAELQARLRAEGVTATESELAPLALQLRTRVNVYALPSFADGWFELQDEGSQLIAELCAPPPGGTILDACAGAGGKTLALGALLQNKGRIVALDIDRRRLSELQKRARRAGLSCVQALCVSADGQRPAHSDAQAGLPPGVLPRGAHRVLCDVPCSGLGVLRRHPEARWHLGPRALEEINVQQRQILAACARQVQPHGRLIYATCTVLRRENDEVVDDFLRAHPEFVEVPVKELLGSARAQRLGDGQRLRLLPTPDGPDGFFAAVLRRREAD
jgi:16S rRNA (cytosine967-C5)-methyltransferase